MTPYLILIGMSPAQAVATGKFGGVGTTFGAVSAFRGKGLVQKNLVWPLIAITVVTSVIAGFTIPRIEAEFFQKTIGILLIVLVPTLFIKKQTPHFSTRGKRSLWLLFAGYSVLSFMQATFGTGLATFVTLLLMLGFGLKPLQANATKRVVQGVQAVFVAVITALQGLVFFAYALAAMVGAMIGSYIGSRIAIRGGDKIVKIFLAGFMIVSGTVLLFSSA
jgi:uncharacterized membrane protein YfcA